MVQLVMLLPKFCLKMETRGSDRIGHINGVNLFIALLSPVYLLTAGIISLTKKVFVTVSPMKCGTAAPARPSVPVSGGKQSFSL